MSEHDNFTRNCSCTVACAETDFSAIVTTSTWPSNQYWVILNFQQKKNNQFYEQFSIFIVWLSNRLGLFKFRSERKSHKTSWSQSKSSTRLCKSWCLFPNFKCQINSPNSYLSSEYYDEFTQSIIKEIILLK